MDREEIHELAERFIGAWNTQDVETVASCYTEDVVYTDPNTRGEIRGSDDFRRYLAKLFAAWEMTWSLKEAFLFEDGSGCAALWHATIRKAGSLEVVDFDGMDLVLVRGDRIERNEVYFDRVDLLPLMDSAG